MQVLNYLDWLYSSHTVSGASSVLLGTKIRRILHNFVQHLQISITFNDEYNFFHENTEAKLDSKHYLFYQQTDLTGTLKNIKILGVCNYSTSYCTPQSDVRFCYMMTLMM